MTQVIRWFHETGLFAFLDVLQGYFGADSPKPTTLMLSGVELPDAQHCERSLRSATCAKGSNIGLEGGKWRTSHLKEYPPAFCHFGATLFRRWLDRQPVRTEAFVESTEWLRSLVLAFEDQQLHEPRPDFFCR